MTVTSTTAAAQTGAATTSTTLGKQASPDFNLFLKLLTTQAQNQDPLNPTDATQYTQQLAQFSQVEQSLQQTNTLKDILSRFSTQDLSSAANLIGREATFDSNTVGLTSKNPARWTYSNSGMTGPLTATIKDAGGRTVSTQTIDDDSGTGEVTWTGTKSDGSQAADGAYTLTVKGQDSGGVSVSATINAIGTVGDVQSKNNVVTVGINGAQLPLSSLIRLTSPKTS